MLKTYTPEYLMANRGSYTELQVTQLINGRTTILFSEIWESRGLPMYEKLFFLVKFAQLSNEEKQKVALMLAHICDDYLKSTYPPPPSGPSATPYQPDISNVFTIAIQTCLDYLSDNDAYATALPGVIKSTNIASGVYQKYFGTDNFRTHAVRAITLAVNMFNFNYLQDIRNYAEFADNAAYAVTYAIEEFKKGAGKVGAAIIADIKSDGTTLVDDFADSPEFVIKDFCCYPPEETPTP